MKCSIKECLGEYEKRKIAHTIRFQGRVSKLSPKDTTLDEIQKETMEKTILHDYNIKIRAIQIMGQKLGGEMV